MKDQPSPSHLDELLGLTEKNTETDQQRYGKLLRLKAGQSLSDAAVTQGFADLLERRAGASSVSHKHRTWWSYGAVAALAIVGVSTLFLVRYAAPETAELLTMNDGLNIRAERLFFPEQKIVEAKVENVDLKIRGVSGFSAQSTRSELRFKFDSGFVNVEYHPGTNRKKLIFQVRDTTFTVTGTKFFIEAGKDLRLLVVEGRVVAQDHDRSLVVASAETWTTTTNAVRKLNSVEMETYVKGFSDTTRKPKEISMAGTNEKPKNEPPKKRVKVFLNLGQIVSGRLEGEDAESVSIATSNGKIIRISRQDIEKIESLP